MYTVCCMLNAYHSGSTFSWKRIRVISEEYFSYNNVKKSKKTKLRLSKIREKKSEVK